MNYRKLTVIALVVSGLIFGHAQLWPQFKEDGINRFNEALKLHEGAQGHEELKRAVEKYQKALEAYKRVGYTAGIGEVSTYLADVYYRLGQYDKAMDYSEKSISNKKKLGDAKGDSVSPIGLTNEEIGWKPHRVPVGFYEKSVALKMELRGKRGEAETLNNLGVAFSCWGHYDKAVNYYERSLTIKRELKDMKGEGETLNNLGLACCHWGKHDEAVTYYELALAIKRELRDRKGEQDTLNRLGNAYSRRGQFDKAVEYYEESLAITKQLKGKKGARFAPIWRLDTNSRRFV